jgi:hypothetical protein
MGDMSCTCTCTFCVLSDAGGLVLADPAELGATPQSSRSGRLSSSSPAQSIWLPGVEGLLWSMAKARTCSTSESIFALAEKDDRAGAAERCVRSLTLIDKEFLGLGEDGPERDLRAFIADASASTVKLSAERVVPEGLLCDRRRRAGMDGIDVVDAERGAEPSELAVGDAGCIVSEGTLSAACCGVARRGPDLGFAEGCTTGGDRVSGEEEFLLGVVE